MSRINFIESKIERKRTFGRGISTIIERTPNNKVTKIIDDKGKDIVRISGDFSEGSNKFSVLLKTKTLEVFRDANKQVRLSELDAKGVVREVLLFTPEGKQTSTPLSSRSFVLQPLESITRDDVLFVGERISKALEMSPPSHFEKLRSHIQRIYR